jgi:hypothetical protein
VRPFDVELAEEGIEAFLLLQAVEAWREVHAFMAAVLLRMTWLDPLDRNAEPEPPHREL